MKNKSTIFIALCMVLCLIPSLGMLFFPTTQTTENRAMAPAPKLIAEDGKLKMWKLAMTEPEFSKVNEYPFAKPDMEEIEVELDGSHPKHPGVLNAFAASILRGEDMIADGREGINGLTLSNAMHLSAFLGKTVEIPFDEDVYYEELKKRIDASALKDSEEKVFVNIDSSYGA